MISPVIRLVSIFLHQKFKQIEQEDSMKTKSEKELKTRIEKILSEILSDKHECRVTLKFEKRETA